MKALRRQHGDRCLGELAAALADGELGAAARDAALAHLVNCDTCRDDVFLQRRLKARLGELSEPLPPAGLADRLSAISSLGATAPDHWRGGPAVPRHRVRLSSRRRPADFDRVEHVRHRSVRYAMAGGVSVLALGVSAFALGGSGQSAPTVVPSVDSFSSVAATNGDVPFGVVPPEVRFQRVAAGTRP